MKTSDDISRIKKYLQGEMKNPELAEFEKMMSEDDFLRDAVDGYIHSQASPDDLKKNSDKIIPKRKNRYFLYGIIYSGIAATIIIVAMIFINLNEKEPSEKIQISQNNHAPEEVTNNDLLIPEFYIEDTSKITPEITNMEVYNTELRTIIQEPEYITESISPLYVNKSLVIENNIPEKNINNYYRFRSNHGYLYLDDFKVVDYRFSKREKKKIYDFSMTTNDENTTENNDKQDISYMAFLEQTLEKVKEKKYYEAIDDFNIILENYPDDENAVFYKGLCYFEVDKNKQSIRCFEKTLDSKINTFHEEAKWYKGLILKKEKEYEIAQKVLEEIVNENGYYGVQARKELDEIYKYYLNE